MKIIFLTLFLTLNITYSVSTKDTIICYVPLEKMYYKNISFSSLATHKDAKCLIVTGNGISKKIIKSLFRLQLSKDTSSNAYAQDFRVSINIEINKKHEVIYISRWGYVFYQHHLYYPNKKFLELIERKTNQHWDVKLYAPHE